jgi:hypothetical protein
VQQARADAATRVLSRRVPFCDAADDSLTRLDTPPYQRTAHVRPKVDNEREREREVGDRLKCLCLYVCMCVIACVYLCVCMCVSLPGAEKLPFVRSNLD